MMGRVAMEIQEALYSLHKTDSSILIALDGRCAAGKTTLAEQLRKSLHCNVVHMDDFFLRPEQRTKERLRQPGGNVDYERFREEVLVPLKQGISFSYRPYNCHTQMLKVPVQVKPNGITLIEGSYSCHPQLWDFYDFHIFLTIHPIEQLRRIRERNGAAEVEIFQKKWIPLEETYFHAFSIQKRCELCYDMDL